MSFLYSSKKIKGNTCFTYKKKNVDIKFIFIIFKRIEKTFSRHALSASLTVEASLIFPLLLFAWLAFMALISVTAVQEHMQHLLSDTALELAYEAGMDREGVCASGAARTQNRLMSIKEMESRGIQEIGGIHLLNSEILKNDEWIHLTSDYEVRLLDGVIPLPPVHLQGTAHVRAWTGYLPEEKGGLDGDMQDMVYVTDYGSVFHTDRMCTHIYLKIYMKSREEALRYPPCEKCAAKEQWETGTYYVTEEGSCYHTRIGCSGLKRSVHSMTREEALKKGYMPCERCGQ